MLKAMVAGTTSPDTLANLAKGRLCGKQPELAQALSGQVRDHHRFLMHTHLEHLEFLEQQVTRFDQRIEQLIEAQSLAAEAPSATDSTPAQPCSWQQAMTLLDTIPGVARQSAELLLAEVGVEMSRFPSAAHLCKWAGVCPGNHESAGKQSSGKTPPSNRWLRGKKSADGKCCCAMQIVLFRDGLPPHRGSTRTQTGYPGSRSSLVDCGLSYA